VRIQRVTRVAIPAGIVALTLVLYLSTLAPGVTWANHGADGGDLMAATMTWGVPHPSGYPTYVLLARGFTSLPIGSLAYRFNLFSAVAGAGAVLTVYYVGRRGLGSGLPAVCAALCLASSRTFWSQAVIAEVYTLSAFLLALCLYMTLCLEAMDGLVPWGAVGCVLGLGLGAHATLALSVPGLSLLVRRRLNRERVLTFLGGLLLGLACFAYLPLAAKGDPPVNWGDANTWRGFWWLVTGRLYRGYLFGLPLNHVLARLSAWASLWGEQWGWYGVALSLAGLSNMWRRRRDLALATLTIFGVYGLYAIGYSTPDSFLYLIPAYVVSALWIGEGVSLLRCEATRLTTSWRHMVGLASVVAACAAPAWAVWANRGVVDASSDLAAQEWLERMAESLPEDALVITGEDRHTFSLAYLQTVEKRRTDLLVVDGDLWHEAWYAEQVRRRWEHLIPLAAGADIPDLVAVSMDKRPVILTSPRTQVTDAWPVVEAAGYWLVVPQDCDP